MDHGVSLKIAEKDEVDSDSLTGRNPESEAVNMHEVDSFIADIDRNLLVSDEPKQKSLLSGPKPSMDNIQSILNEIEENLSEGNIFHQEVRHIGCVQNETPNDVIGTNAETELEIDELIAQVFTSLELGQD